MIALTIVGTELPGRACGPYREVEVGLQRGRDAVELVAADAPEARWTISVADAEDGDARGPEVHGRRGERFVYLVWRGREGPAPVAMFRRAKLQLDGVPPAVWHRARQTGALTATLGLTDERGMPRCASVRPPRIAWSSP